MAPNTGSRGFGGLVPARRGNLHSRATEIAADNRVEGAVMTIPIWVIAQGVARSRSRGRCRQRQRYAPPARDASRSDATGRCRSTRPPRSASARRRRPTSNSPRVGSRNSPGPEGKATEPGQQSRRLLWLGPSPERATCPERDSEHDSRLWASGAGERWAGDDVDLEPDVEGLALLARPSVAKDLEKAES